MRRSLLGSAALALALVVASPAFAASYFLDNTISGDSDSNACTVSSATCATLAGVIAKMAAGDTLFIGAAHAETSTATTYTFPGTAAAPNYIYAVNDAAWAGGHTPVSADLTDPSHPGGVTSPVITDTATPLGFLGTFTAQGLTIKMGAATGNQALNLSQGGPAVQRWKRTEFMLSSTTGFSYLELGYGGGSTTYLTDCELYTAVVGDYITSSNGLGYISGNGLGSFLAAGSTVPTAFFNNVAGPLIVDGVDLSAITTILVENPPVAQVILRNDRLNSGVTYAAGLSTNLPTIVQVENSSSAATNYELHWRTLTGSVDTDATNYRTGGMTYNGTNGISYKMTGSANATVTNPLIMPPIDLGHLSTGSATTIKVYFMFDGANNTEGFNSTTLNNNQLWASVGWGGSASYPINSFSNNKINDSMPSTTPATQGTVSGTWTAPTPTTPELYAMTVGPFTPLIAGHYELFVEAAIGAGKIIWVDPQYTCTGNCN
jgi:hypothetical protein